MWIMYSVRYGRLNIDYTYEPWLTLIPAWKSNYFYYKVWDEIAYPFPNLNGVYESIYLFAPSKFGNG